MTDAKQPERSTQPFSPDAAKTFALTLNEISTALGKAAAVADAYSYPDSDQRFSETARGLTRHAAATVNELIGMYREYAARKQPERTS